MMAKQVENNDGIIIKKIIKALEWCTSETEDESCVGHCPYAISEDDYKCTELQKDMLKLLKTLYVKPEVFVKSVVETGEVISVQKFCGHCYAKLRDEMICPRCGRWVAQDDE